MKLKRSDITKGELLLLFSGLVALITLLFVYNKPPFYDEDDYLQNVVLLHKYGFSKEYLLHHIGSAGPLYPVVHYLLGPLTKLQTPHIRLVNIVFLAGTMFLTSLILQQLSFSRRFAFHIMAIPMTYVISGLALTEMPAIFFFTAGVYLILKTTSKKASHFISIIQLVLGGLFISLAILGRQPFLLTLGALPFLFFDRKNYSRSILYLSITILFALLLPCYVFFVWKGLVAPTDAMLYEDIVQQGINYRPESFLLCLAYFAIIFILIAPGFYARPTLKEVIGFISMFIVFSAINFKYKIILSLPIGFFITEIFTRSFLDVAEVLFGAGLLVMGIYFLFSLVRQLHKRNYQKQLTFFASSLLLIAISCIKITWGFSSRYPAQVIPLLVILCAYFYKRDSRNVYRVAIGVTLGLVSYASYMMFDHL